MRVSSYRCCVFAQSESQYGLLPNRFSFKNKFASYKTCKIDAIRRIQQEQVHNHTLLPVIISPIWLEVTKCSRVFTPLHRCPNESP